MSKKLKIEGESVTDDAIGKVVRYVPLHANGDAGHSDVEGGVITSYNDKYIFVRYGSNHHSKATDASDLVWG